MLTTLTQMSRSSRRLTRTVRLMAQQHLVRRLGGTARRPALRGRADQLSRVAADLVDSFGIDVRVHGRAPKARVVYVAEPAGYLEALVVLARVPAMVLVDRPVDRRLGRPLPRWPILGPVATDLELVADVYGLGLRGALAACGAALDEGLPILLVAKATFSIAELLARHQVPVIPVAVRADHAHTLRGRLAIASRSSTRVDIAFGGRIGPAAMLGSGSASRLAHRA